MFEFTTTVVYLLGMSALFSYAQGWLVSLLIVISVLSKRVGSGLLILKYQYDAPLSLPSRQGRGLVLHFSANHGYVTFVHSICTISAFLK